jgi:hypothetical protein
MPSRCPCKPSWHLWHGSCPASKTFTYENVKIDSPQNVNHPYVSPLSLQTLRSLTFTTTTKWFLQLFPRNSTHLFVTRQISFLWSLYLSLLQVEWSCRKVGRFCVSWRIRAESRTHIVGFYWWIR